MYNFRSFEIRLAGRTIPGAMAMYFEIEASFETVNHSRPCLSTKAMYYLRGKKN